MYIEVQDHQFKQAYLFQFCHRIFTLWDSMHEAGRCRTFNILVGFPHKITDSNHSRHFEADFFSRFFLSFKCDFFLKSKTNYIYIQNIDQSQNQVRNDIVHQTQASKSLKNSNIFCSSSSLSNIFFLDAAKGEKVTHFT